MKSELIDLEDRLEKYLDSVKVTVFWGMSCDLILDKNEKIRLFEQEIWPKLINNEEVFAYNDLVHNRRYINSTRKWKKVCSLVHRHKTFYLTSNKEHVRKLAEIIDRRLYVT